ncbi:hypothetical protein KJ912_01785 [Patescibacteria group bacterium]|nr:hypothetical protein [Patescibacteria group bacterium]
MNKHTTIYIEENEEITSIVERIKKTPANEIALVVPRRSFLSQGIVNLKILKSQSQKMGKKLMLVTRDTLCRTLAEKIGLSTEEKLDQETLKRTQVDTLKPPEERSADLEVEKRTVFTKTIRPQVESRVREDFYNKVDAGPSQSLGAGNMKSSVDGVSPSAPSAVDLRSSHDLKRADLNQENTVSEPVFTGKKLLDDYPRRKELKVKERLIDFWQKLSNKIQDKKQEKLKQEQKLIKPILQRDVGIRMGDGQKRGEGDAYGIKSIALISAKSVKFLGLFSIVLLAAVFWVLALVLPRAEVEIVPKKEKVMADLKLETALDSVKNSKDQDVIEVIEFSEEITQEQKVTAGKQEENADFDSKPTGMITVKNEYSTSPEILVTGTRFVTGEGLVLKSLKEVRIPGFTKKSGEIIPGRANVEVVADKQGQGVSAFSGKLTIPGLKDDPRYEKMYGEIEISLGMGANISTELDFQKAKEQIRDKLAAQKPGYKVIEDSLILGKAEWETRKIAGQEIQYEVQGKASAKILAYREDDLLEIVEYFLNDKVAQNQRLTGKPEIEVSGFNKDKERGKNEIKVRAWSFGVREMDQEALKSDILGLSAKEAEERINGSSQVEGVSIKCWPFWVRTVPENENRVKIRLVY